MWDFIQDDIFGMKWLNRLIGSLLNACGLDTGGKVGGSLQFFIYDIIKIMLLLCLLIFIVSYIQSFFPPERTKKTLHSCVELHEFSRISRRKIFNTDYLLAEKLAKSTATTTSSSWPAAYRQRDFSPTSPSSTLHTTCTIIKRATPTARSLIWAAVPELSAAYSLS